MTLRIDLRLARVRRRSRCTGWLSAAEVAELEKTVAEAGLPLRIDLAQLAGADAEGRRAPFGGRSGAGRNRPRGLALTSGCCSKRSAAGAEGEPQK